MGWRVPPERLRKFLLARYLYNRIDVKLIDSELSKYIDDCGNYDKYLPDIRYLLGYIPLLNYLWELDEFVCPCCQSEMPFLSTIDDEYTDSNGNIVNFTGEMISIISAFCTKWTFALCHLVSC